MAINKNANYIAAGLLAAMFFLMFFSARGDSAIMDELAHIPAGYSYLIEKDMRLNPEHPPLIKDLSALPLLFLDLNFPTNQNYWIEDINGQWTAGSVFLYESGNDPDKILFWSRLPLMILAIIFGFMLFLWARGIYGNKIGLLTLFFYSFSPTFLAHSRYVTTDLAAAFGFFIGIVSFVKFLKNSKEKNNAKFLIIAGAAFGAALLLKFSLFLLIPLYLLLGFLWVFVNFWNELKEGGVRAVEKLKFFIKEYFVVLWQTALIFALGGILVWIVYTFHVWNYPTERQFADSKITLASFGNRTLADSQLKMVEIPVLRPLAQYFFGLLMVVQRAAGGNTVYFLGEISAAGWKHYFPIAYLLKEHLAFHILTLLALYFFVKKVIISKNRNFGAMVEWIKDNFALASGAIFVVVYFIQSILSPLNIGVRHILPTFPFIYLLVARGAALWANDTGYFSGANFGVMERLKFIYHRYVKIIPRYLTVFAVLLWIFLAAVFSFPYYLSYYNELGGGVKNGYKHIVDSNYDWGQDLKRLVSYVEKNNIPEIRVDYFGGGSPKYYLGDKYIYWNSAKKAPQSGYLAVSATFLQNGAAKPVKGFTLNKDESYYFLKDKTPVARAGSSIFIYEF